MSKYAKSQRVFVPGQGHIQGLIFAVTESLPQYPIYELRWIDDSGEPRKGDVGENDIAAANVITADHVVGVDGGGRNGKLTVSIGVDTKKLQRAVAQIKAATRPLRIKPAAPARKR